MSFAKPRSELEEVLKLRYRIFNLELGGGQQESAATGMDEDVFDHTCHHLMVTHAPSGAMAGTYRMQTYEMSEISGGFYSNGEYRLKALPDEVLKQSDETGRACIDRDHRSGRMLFLLRKGLCAYIRKIQKCCLSGFECSPDLSAETNKKYQVKIPQLMALYLKYGAVIVSPPATGRAFKTIGYLALMDMHDLNDIVKKQLED